MTCRNWCFTINVSDDKKWERIKHLPDKVKYIIYQKEKAPTTGKIHYQGYIQFSNSVRMEGVKNLKPYRLIYYITVSLLAVHYPSLYFFLIDLSILIVCSATIPFWIIKFTSI